jgi:HK97 family phage prohead protease
MKRFNCGIEFKFAEDGAETMSFEGYGAVFGNVDSYGDVIAPGAFAATLAEAHKSGQRPAMLLQHGGVTGEDMTPIGVWQSMSEDGAGLQVKGQLAPTPRGREVYELLKMGAINGLSIGYIAKEWQQRSKPEEPRRTLKAIDLYEVSLVTFPANPKARVQNVKSTLTERIAEQALRDAGFSRTEAKAIVANGFGALECLRDAGNDEAADELAKLVARIRA